MAYDRDKAKYYYELSKLDYMPDRVDNCNTSCLAHNYCKEGKIPPFYHKEFYTEIENLFSYPIATAGLVGLNNSQLQQWGTIKELKDWILNHRGFNKKPKIGWVG